MMREDVKKLWVEALRSGKYQQGTGCLRMDDTFCCLGVLCDLHAKETGGKWDDRNEYLDCSGILPSRVRDWAGLDQRDPFAGDTIPLTGHNDRLLKTFPEIADLIEKHL